MAAHKPPPDDFVPWVDRLANWWNNRKLQKQFRREIEDTNGFELFRQVYDYGPKDEDNGE